MATYEVTGPDGSVYEFTAPDNATEADVNRVISEQFGFAKQNTMLQTPTQNRLGLPSPGQRQPAGPPVVPGGIDGEIIPQPQGEFKPGPRFGDNLRPVFGNRNPIAETMDVALPALDPTSSRPIMDRAQDAVNFAASTPLQAFRLPSFGQMASDYLGNDTLLQSEQRFVENNPDLLRGLGALGEAAPGISAGLGQGAANVAAPVNAGARQVRSTVQPRPAIARQISDDTARARASAEDMRELGITPYGPAVAAARRGDNSPGAVTQVLADKPFVGGPLQRGAAQFVDETVEAFERVRGQYGPDADIQTAGGRIKAAVNENRSVRDADVKSMSMQELQELANRPVRAEGFRDVQSAKYELAERLLPDGKLGRKSVGKGATRDFALPGHTQQVLLEIKNRKGQTINQSASRSGKGGKFKTGDLDFQNPNWTNNRDLNQSLDLLAENSKWRTGITGIREIRSMIRRTKAGMKGDNEVRTLAKGDLKRLENAVTRDLYGLFERVIADEMKAGRTQLADQYRAAFNAMKEADGFTRKYETEVFGPLKRILHEDITPGNAAAEIMTAMKDGTRGNIERLIALSRAVPGEVIDDLASSILREIGRPLKGASGPVQEAGVQLSRLVSSWNELNPKARRIIFGRDPKKLQQVERLIRVAENLKDFERLANNSRTGISNAVVGLVAAGGYGLSMLSPQILATVMGLTAAGWGSSKFLASPAYVAWLERAARMQTSQPRARAMHIRKLQHLIRNDRNLPPQAARSMLMMTERALQQEQNSNIQ